MANAPLKKIITFYVRFTPSYSQIGYYARRPFWRRVRGDFAEFAPVTLADVAPPWPDLEYLQDFHVLSEADVVGVSAASGFSQLAARLNQRARILVQPDIATQRIVPFIPWTGD